MEANAQYKVSVDFNAVSALKESGIGEWNLRFGFNGFGKEDSPVPDECRIFLNLGGNTDIIFALSGFA